MVGKLILKTKEVSETLEVENIEVYFYIILEVNLKYLLNNHVPAYGSCEQL